MAANGPFLALCKHGRYVPVSVALGEAGLAPVPDSMLGVLDGGSAVWDTLRSLDEALDVGAIGAMAVAHPHVLAPIPTPRKNVMCVGRNYADHAAELGADAPIDPVFFTKAPTTVIGPDAVVPYPPGSAELDYEGELALVIGRQGVDIAPEHALSHVFGVTILNDISARDVQYRHIQWFKGKSFDGTCPTGPVIVTLDEVGDLRSLRVQTYVNGELRQDQPVSDMIFDVPSIIATLSSGMTLEPGDIIATGTPAGVGAPDRRFLVPGDRVDVRIDGLGVLCSTIGARRGVPDVHAERRAEDVR